MKKTTAIRIRWSRMWLPMLLIVVSVLVIYSNTWRSPFVFDDIHTIVESEARRTLYFTVERWFGNRTLPVFSFDLNYYFNGLNVVGYHAVNIGIHIITAIGVFWLAYWLSAAAYETKIIKLGKIEISNHLLLAQIAGLFFAVHPIQTQAVTYVVQRLAAMAAMWYVLALAAYVKFRLSTNDSKKIWAGLSLAATLAAMHSKETAVTLPVVIVLIELLYFTPAVKNSRWWLVVDWRVFLRRILFLLPWVITVVIIPLYMLGIRDLFIHSPTEPSSMAGETVFDRINIGRIGSVSAETTAISRETYFLTQINVVRTYWRLIVWPRGQNIDHDYALTTSWRDTATIGSLSLHAAILLVAVGLWHKDKKIAASGIGFFYIALLPESSIIPIIDVIFEHRLYLPMIGVALLAGDIGQNITDLSGKIIKEKFKVVTVVCLAMIIGALGTTAYSRNGVWKNEVSLWTDALSKSPNKARPHNNLGKAYLDQRMFDEAERLYQREIELDPNSASGHNNLGSIYGVKGRYEEAIKEIERALEINPSHDSAYNNLGNVFMMQGRLQEAEEAYKKSIALNTKDAGVYRNLGDVLIKQNKYEEAVQAYRQAVTLVPNQALWFSKLGAALGALSRNEEAKQELVKAIQLDPQMASAYSNLGNVLAAEGDLTEAAKMYAVYLQLTPGDIKVMSNLAQVFRMLGNQQKAEEVWRAMLRIDPENKDAKAALNLPTSQ